MNILRPDNLVFPNLQTANREGLLALGGDLSVARLLLAYRSGIFPWTDEPLTWWSPRSARDFRNRALPSAEAADVDATATYVQAHD